MGSSGNSSSRIILLQSFFRCSVPQSPIMYSSISSQARAVWPPSIRTFRSFERWPGRNMSSGQPAR